MTTRNPSKNNQKPPKRVYFAALIMVFFCTVSAADSVGFVPYYIDGTAPRAQSVALSELPQLSPSTTSVRETALPERIKIPAIDLDLPVLNPDTRDLAVLDAAILKGPARYVDSAKLGEAGNMLIFAHSSTYRVVRNQMYKAFNRISELKAGDPITVEGKGKQYLYRVTSVRKADVSEAVIDLSPTQGTKLTLTTCDILTGKTARFVVEAEYVGVVNSQ